MTRPGPRCDRLRRPLTLACSVVGAAVVALDGTVLTIAQPALQHDLGADTAQVQWTSTGYLVAVASLLVFAGRLGDRYGHQRLFVLGCLGFAATSAGIAAAPGIGWVVALRVTQGVFGALLQPATLGMLRAAYPPDRLGMPIALRTSAIGLAAAVGPLVGGVLVTAYGWRAVFLLGVPPTLAIALIGLVVATSRQTTREEGRGSGAGALDLPGACLLGLALACLVQALAHGFAPPALGGALLALGVAGAAGYAFVRHERRAPHPLVPAGMLIESRPGTKRGSLGRAGPEASGRGPGPVVAGLGALLAASAALSGTLFTATYLLQDTLALGPLPTAARMLPLALLIVAGAPVSALLKGRLGARRVAAGGAGLLVAGVALLGRTEVTGSALATGGCAALIGAGFGAVMVTATSVVVHRAPREHAGVAGGLQQTAMNTGPVLGVALAAPLLASGTALPVLAAVAALAVLGCLGLPGDRAAGAGVDADPEPGAERRMADTPTRT
ncbi:MFS transporter [Streptomyces laurentii]|uniref:MFS transporter n=1 Tax=Streptomyces laurentii TaxID=39478 RepID=UPI0036A36F1B